jgi:hypothetical protein
MHMKRFTPVTLAFASLALALGTASPAHALHSALVGDVYVDFNPLLVRPTGLLTASLFSNDSCGLSYLGGCGIGSSISPLGFGIGSLGLSGYGGYGGYGSLGMPYGGGMPLSTSYSMPTPFLAPQGSAAAASAVGPGATAVATTDSTGGMPGGLPTPPLSPETYGAPAYAQSAPPMTVPPAQSYAPVASSYPSYPAAPLSAPIAPYGAGLLGGACGGAALLSPCGGSLGFGGGYGGYGLGLGGIGLGITPITPFVDYPFWR